MMALYQDLLKRRNPVVSEDAEDDSSDMLLQQVSSARSSTGMKPSTLPNDSPSEVDDSFQNMMMDRLMQQQQSDSRMPAANKPAMGKPIKKTEAASTPKPAAAAASKSAGAAMGGGGGGLMEMLQGMMRGGRPADVVALPEVEEDGGAGTCAGGSCLAQDGAEAVQGVKSAGRGRDPLKPRPAAAAAPAAARMKRGGGGAGASVYDAVCEQQFGARAVFDGVDGCTCAEGYELVDGQCAPAQPPAAAGRGRSAAATAGRMLAGSDSDSVELVKVCVS